MRPFVNLAQISNEEIQIDMTADKSPQLHCHSYWNKRFSVDGAILPIYHLQHFRLSANLENEMSSKPPEM